MKYDVVKYVGVCNVFLSLKFSVGIELILMEGCNKVNVNFHSKNVHIFKMLANKQTNFIFISDIFVLFFG